MEEKDIRESSATGQKKKLCTLIATKKRHFSEMCLSLKKVSLNCQQGRGLSTSQSGKYKPSNP